MKAISMIFAAVLLGVSGSAASQSSRGLTANDLYSICQSNRNVCMAYVRGAVEGYQWSATVHNNKDLFCLPTGHDFGQVTDVVIKSLRDDPANRHEQAILIVLLSVVKAFPCG